METRYVEFRTLDGLIVCPGCGARYSDVLSLCPGCATEIVYKRPVMRVQIRCEQGYLCEEGGPDGICCVSCSRFEVCKAPCFISEGYRNIFPEEDDVLCEFMKFPERGKVYTV